VVSIPGAGREPANPMKQLARIIKIIFIIREELTSFLTGVQSNSTRQEKGHSEEWLFENERGTKAAFGYRVRTIAIQSFLSGQVILGEVSGESFPIVPLRGLNHWRVPGDFSFGRSSRQLPPSGKART
jgi:hypothetical protein